MADFLAFNATSHPIVRLEDDWNNLLDHGLEKTPAFICRVSGSYYEAVNGTTGLISYGGSGNIGSTDGTDPQAVIQAALTNLTAGRTYLETVVVKGSWVLDDDIALSANTILDLRQAFIQAETGWAGGENLIEVQGINCAVIGGQIDGNGENVHGIRTYYGNFTARDIEIFDCGYNCISAWAEFRTVENVWFENIYCHNTLVTAWPPIALTNTGSGAAFYVGNGQITNCTVNTTANELGFLMEGDVRDTKLIGCHAEDCAGDGFMTDTIADGTPTGTTYTNCTSFSNGGSGLTDDGADTVIDSCTFSTNDYDGIYLYDTCSKVRITNCTIINNGVDSVAGRTNGIRVDDSVDTVEIYSNKITDTSGDQDYGIFIGPSADKVWIGRQRLDGNNTGPISIDTTATNIHLPTISGQFCYGANYGAIGTPLPEVAGWDVDAADDFAHGFVTLPSDCVEVISVKVWAMSVVLEADGMALELNIYAGNDNEAVNAHDVSLATQISDSTNFAANDLIYWYVDKSDDADLASFSAGDQVYVVAAYEAASGANCATDARFRSFEIRYV
jgi:parallel beta-helix repeat protein